VALLPHEVLVAPPDLALIPPYLPEARLKELRLIREQLQAMLQDGDCTSLEDLRRYVARHLPALLSIDRSLRLEAEFLSSDAEQAYQASVDRMLLSWLPSPQCNRDVSECLHEVAKFKAAPEYKYLSFSIKGRVDAFADLLQAFARGRAPSEGLRTQAFGRKVQDGLVGFARWTPPEEGQEELRGSAALEAIYQHCKARHEGGTLQIAELKTLQSLAFALSAEQRVDVPEWLKAALARLGAVAQKAEGAEAAAAAPKGKKAQAAQAAEASEASDMLALFD
jgi:hypothetical protein